MASSDSTVRPPGDLSAADPWTLPLVAYTSYATVDGAPDAHRSLHRVEVPLLSVIDPTLALGGTIGGVQLPAEDFYAVFSLFFWENYQLGGGDILSYRHTFFPSDEFFPHESESLLYRLARAVNSARRAASAEGENRKVLVCCQAGLNRSAVLAALALILSGMPAQEAIDLLRDRRSCYVLGNPRFTHWLLETNHHDIVDELENKGWQ